MLARERVGPDEIFLCLLEQLAHFRRAGRELLYHDRDPFACLSPLCWSVMHSFTPESPRRFDTSVVDPTEDPRSGEEQEVRLAALNRSHLARSAAQTLNHPQPIGPELDLRRKSRSKNLCIKQQIRHKSSGFAGTS